MKKPWNELRSHWGSLRLRRKVAACAGAALAISITAAIVIQYMTAMNDAKCTDYPMAGPISIVDKKITDQGPCLIAQELFAGSFLNRNMMFLCTQDQYDGVEIDDIVWCERYQSIVTYSGVVHSIRTLREEDLWSLQEYDHVDQRLIDRFEFNE